MKKLILAILSLLPFACMGQVTVYENLTSTMRLLSGDPTNVRGTTGDCDFSICVAAVQQGDSVSYRLHVGAYRNQSFAIPDGGYLLMKTFGGMVFSFRAVGEVSSRYEQPSGANGYWCAVGVYPCSFKDLLILQNEGVQKMRLEFYSDSRDRLFQSDKVGAILRGQMFPLKKALETRNDFFDDF